MWRRLRKRLATVQGACICLMLCVTSSGGAYYGYSQYERWHQLREQGQAYQRQLATRLERTRWLTAWRLTPQDKLAYIQDAAARQHVQIVSYEAERDDAYALTICGTFPNIVLLLQEMEGLHPQLSCRSISIERTEDIETLNCKITV